MTTIYLAITKINPDYVVKYAYSREKDVSDVQDGSYNKILNDNYTLISPTKPFILEYLNGTGGNGIETDSLYPSDTLYFKFLRRDKAPINIDIETNIIEYFLTYDTIYSDNNRSLADNDDNTKRTVGSAVSGLLAYGSYNIQYQVSNTPVLSINASTLVSNFVKVMWRAPTSTGYTGYRINFTLNNQTFDPVASFTVSSDDKELIAILPESKSYRVSVIALYAGTEASLLSDTIIYTGIASTISLKELLEYQEEVSIRETLKNNGNTTPLKTIGGNTLIAHSDLVRFNTIENTTEEVRSFALNTPNIPYYKSYSDYNMARIGRNQRRFVL